MLPGRGGRARDLLGTRAPPAPASGVGTAPGPRPRVRAAALRARALPVVGRRPGAAGARRAAIGRRRRRRSAGGRGARQLDVVATCAARARERELGAHRSRLQERYDGERRAVAVRREQHGLRRRPAPARPHLLSFSRRAPGDRSGDPRRARPPRNDGDALAGVRPGRRASAKRWRRTRVPVLVRGESGTGQGGPGARHPRALGPARPVRRRQLRRHPGPSSWSRSSSATGRERSRARARISPAWCARRTAAPCFSTRSATCRCRPRPRSCASCRRTRCCPWAPRSAASVDLRVIAATHRDLEAHGQRRQLPAGPATRASTASRWTCRRCATVSRTWRCSSRPSSSKLAPERPGVKLVAGRGAGAARP